jgi:purine-nucleoside phosphorylase
MTNDSQTSSIGALANALSQHGLADVRLALVLGSGLGGLADRLQNARAIESAEIDEMPRSAVAGHAGRLIVGEIGGERVLVQQGRVHLYEGHSAHEATRFVRALARMGCQLIVLTNAAGGLRRDWPVGSLMRVTDHINLQGATPLGTSERGAATPYDETVGAALSRGAKDAGVPLYGGVYVGLRGPSYETPAEIRDLRRMGASAVGMSTVAEALAAYAAGMRVAAVSCITNHAAGIADRPLSHADVLEVGSRAAEKLGDVLESSFPHLVAELRR